MNKRVSRPYVDRGAPGAPRYIGGVMPLVKEPPSVPLRILQVAALRRHNTLEPQLEETNRILLRWSESGGTGLPNPEAETRETHFDPLPPDLQEKVDGIVDVSPWKTLTIKWYRSPIERRGLADVLRISRSQLYTDWRCSLWYYRGRFEFHSIHG
jgi:hypothetical protein